MTKHLVDGVPRNEYVRRPDQVAKRKEYRDTHKEEHKLYYREYRKRHPERSLFRAAQGRAKKKGLDFSLNYSDIVIPEYCPILGIKLENNQGTGCGGKFNSPSVDRKDPRKGYTPDNIWVISHQANCMKSYALPEQLLAFAEWVINNKDNLCHVI